MSLLPQNKKSAEQIAHLRERLGIPCIQTEPMPVQETVPKIISATHEAGIEQPLQTIRVEPPPVAIIGSPSDSLSEPSVKRVRSLRKSEQIPLPPPKSAPVSPASPLPFHRHSDHELSEIRRRESLSLLGASAPPKNPHAHPALLAPGYLISTAAALGIYYYDLHMVAAAGCMAAALLLAILIFIRHPYSRHHAAFIAVTTLFVMVFAALHYFPKLNLQHGS